MESILAFVPEEHRVEYSAMTGQSLFYMGEQDLKHKVLAIVEEEGASRAAYALKLLQSEGALSIASPARTRHRPPGHAPVPRSKSSRMRSSRRGSRSRSSAGGAGLRR